MVKKINELKPIYNITKTNEDILIGKGDIELYYKDDEIKGKGKVVQRFLPSPALIVEAVIRESVTELFINNDKIKINFPSLNFLSDMEILGMEVSNNSKLILTPSTSHISCSESSKIKLKTVVFHLVNFLDFRCKKDSIFDPTEKKWVQCVVLECAEWKITIKALSSTNDTIKELKKTGGYAITHIGMFERTNGKAFSIEEANEVLRALKSYLSFARGFWVEPILSVGFNTRKKIIWRNLGVGFINPWKTVRSSFDDFHGEFLSEVFPGFWNKWNCHIWKQTIYEAISWYLIGNTSPQVEPAIITTQAALELLTYVYVVKHKKDKRGVFTTKLKSMLNEFNIPLIVPSESKKLKLLADMQGWDDGVETLNMMRNSIVHAANEHKKSFKGSKIQGWQYGLWLLELILLRLFEYQGEYSNRLKSEWRGEVEALPWS